MSSSQTTALTERQLNLCEYGGTFGVLLSLTCLIQHLIVTINNWITRAMTPYYLFAIVVFILLGLKKPVHVLQLGSSIRSIFNMVLIAVVDAQMKCAADTQAAISKSKWWKKFERTSHEL